MGSSSKRSTGCPDEHATEGSAWVDTKAGTLLSAGFKLSKPGFLVDYVKLTLVFGAPTELGRVFKQINAPVGAFGSAAIQASTAGG